MTQAIELRIPNERPFHGVARLVVRGEAIAMAIGPLNGEAVRADLEQSSDGDLGLGRLLGTLVEDAGVEAREDGDWLRLSKRVRGIKPAGTNA